ncbi:MAG: uracil-DNA glycosylase [Rhodoferax sp.]|uniref:uracil-DNA glycosylase n=1 Tax=Rhodoferax sp. TaxID=50421 RepID=UPI001400E722|nr:uracil-DNA glycosylase [Rhodoferax sp.]NDP40110.1 uracil-DNA glycosylase [Rhodoferax sp.]
MFAPDVPRLTDWAPERWPVAADWRPVVEQFLTSAVGEALAQFLRARLARGAIIFPPQPLRALVLTPRVRVKVVILGQDPYHGPGQAEGLAFSVAPGVKPPPSLRNIFKEIAQDPLLGPGNLIPQGDGSLVAWARQGVLLLNSCLTVEEGQPASHHQRGWETLTDEVVKAVASKAEPVVFLLWGAHAQAKQHLIAATARQGGRATADHLVLTANHPSPLSARRPPLPFLGCGHFGLANAYLLQHGCAPIAW